MRSLIHIISLLSLFWLTPVRVEARTEITEGDHDGQPVAVIPFSWSGTGIAEDLRHSGRFNPMPAGLLAQTPDSVCAITPSLWRDPGISVGNVRSGANGQYLISYQLVNTSTGVDVVIPQAQFMVTSPERRDAAHTISDQIYARPGTQNRGQHPVRRDLIPHEPREMTGTLPDETPAIAPNGSMIIHSPAQGTGSVLQLISADGRFRAMLPAEDAQLSSPAWSLYL